MFQYTNRPTETITIDDDIDNKNEGATSTSNMASIPMDIDDIPIPDASPKDALIKHNEVTNANDHEQVNKLIF